MDSGTLFNRAGDRVAVTRAAIASLLALGTGALLLRAWDLEGWSFGYSAAVLGPLFVMFVLLAIRYGLEARRSSELAADRSTRGPDPDDTDYLSTATPTPPYDRDTDAAGVLPAKDPDDGGSRTSPDPPERYRSNLLRVSGFTLLWVGYPLAWSSVGFILATSVTLWLSLVLLQVKRSLVAAAASVATAVFLFWFMEGPLNVPLPGRFLDDALLDLMLR